MSWPAHRSPDDPIRHNLLVRQLTSSPRHRPCCGCGAQFDDALDEVFSSEGPLRADAESKISLAIDTR